MLKGALELVFDYLQNMENYKSYLSRHYVTNKYEKLQNP